MKCFIHSALFITAMCASAPAANKIEFDREGICHVDGKPFFPIGCWVYGLNPDVFADLHDHHFNTLVGIGFKPEDVKLIESHGLMMIPPGTDAFLKAAKASPSLLGWYLEDEPEEHDVAVDKVVKKYHDLKQKDPAHPIGLTHCQLIAPKKYKDACDFTMTDVYPITKNRDFPITHVGLYTDEPRKVHGPGWPNFTFIQTFGGPNSDGGKWAQPLPSEVRFMAFQALVHHANGILYFSYWPQATTTWASISTLNNDIRRLVPWLITPGEEIPAKSIEGMEVRARKVGPSWIVIVVNATQKPRDASIQIDGLTDQVLRLPFEPARTISANNGQWHDRFDAYEAKVYLHGDEPQ